MEAQGVLTVTPGRTAATAAGTGAVGYTGDGGPGASATLARPAAMAYDAAGDLLIADANNDVVRQISPAGVITTLAGTGVAGFGGDGGAALSAVLDTPTGLAVDRSGNVFIADSHNHRIREVSGGIISTVAGTGTAGFSGDGGVAIQAQLALPSSVAVDASGALYIADTNNQRIRKVAAGTITTVAGNGEELLAGDGGAATAASLDQPTGVAVDSSGALYIADKNNQRVRVVSAAGTISTIAGSGAPGFAGDFGGDGGSPTAALLARPVSVSLDSSGNVYIADTNNQRVRQLAPGGAIATVAGTGDQGFAGDGGAAISAILNAPRAVTTDASGNVVLADSGNERVRLASLGTLTFSGEAVGTVSAPQVITLANSGIGSLTIASANSTGPFALVSGGSCSSAPITLASGAACTVNVVYSPVAAQSATGAVAFSGAGLATQTVLLAGGIATPGTTTLALTASKAASLSGESVTFTATIGSPGGSSVAAAGSVTFYDGATVLGSSGLVNGVATLTTTQLPDGSQAIHAAYSGSAAFAGSSSEPVEESVGDYSLAISTPAIPTVEPGHSVSVPVNLTIATANGLTGSIALTAVGLPPGLTVAFSPAQVSLNSGQMLFTMNVTAAPTTVAQSRPFRELGLGSTALALLLLPAFGRRRRQLAQKMRPVLVLLVFAGAGMLLSSIVGCSGSTGFFGQAPKTYSFTVTGTATDSTGGVLSRSTAASVNVQ